jgi:hypothetical protein
MEGVLQTTMGWKVNRPASIELAGGPAALCTDLLDCTDHLGYLVIVDDALSWACLVKAQPV